MQETASSVTEMAIIMTNGFTYSRHFLMYLLRKLVDGFFTFLVGYYAIMQLLVGYYANESA